MRIRDLAAGRPTCRRARGHVLRHGLVGGRAHLFYAVPDDAMRPYQVWRHELGTAQADDVLVSRRTTSASSWASS